MKLNVAKQDLRTLGLVGGFGLMFLWVYVGYIVGPLFREAGTLGNKVRSEREELKMLRAATANEAAIREQHRQLDETVVSLRSMMPPEEELPSVIELLSDLATQTQVKIQTIFPQRPLVETGGTQDAQAAEPVVYTEIPIHIDAQAAYHQLGTFLSLVESGAKPMQLSSLRISGNPKDPRWHNVSMVILAYFAVETKS